MADWTKLSLIDAIERRESSQGRSLVGRYYMQAADIAHLPRRGEYATGIEPTWFVEDVIASPISSLQYIVAISAVPRLGMFSHHLGANASDRYETSFETSEILITPAMLGIVPLTAEDGGQPISADMPNWKPAGTMSVATWNTHTPQDCPFERRPHHKYVGKTFPCLVAVLTFHSAKRAINLLGGWQGVNSRKYATVPWPFPSRFDIPNRLDEGYWRALPGKAQEVEPVTDTETGEQNYRVIRRIERAPLGVFDYTHDPAYPKVGTNVVWSSDRNGGEMEW